MNKVVLKFGPQVFTAKFGIGFIGRYLEKRGQSIDEMFKDFQSNPFAVVPEMMYNSVKEGTEGFELSQSDFEDLIDEDGGISSKQLEVFITAFTKSITVNSPDLGKPKAKAKAKP